MNKDIFEAANVIADIEDEMISDAAAAKKKPAFRMGWLAAAAAVAVLAGAAIALPKIIKPKGNDVTASVPTNAPVYSGETNAPGEAVSTPSPTETAWTDVDATNAPDEPFSSSEPMMTAAPQPTAPSVMNYSSVQTLQLAVSSGKNKDENDPLYGLDYIYMPVRVPYGAELTDIEVSVDSVIITYGIKKNYVVEEDDPNRVVLVWHRNWIKGSAEEYARSLNESMRGYFFRETYGVWVFQFNLEMAAIWEEDGKGFELIMPGYCSDDADVMKYKDLTLVKLDEAWDHDPFEGNEDDGFLQIRELEFIYAPRVSFAYGVSYFDPERLGEGPGSMMSSEGLGFIESIPEDQRSYDKIMKYFPQFGRLFETVLRDGAEIVRIDVYDPITFEPIELDISMDALRRIADGEVSEEMSSYIFGDCRGSVLVDMVVEHRGDYISELDEYELEAYHCAFIIDCGY